ncbi:hypothetical protein [Streptomyces cylindrosporus]|uniref:Transposase n=1 Tax=Streptomyces cylindrosporus TaxID=2927583 RepID=A0ABS9XZ16_9ACTN|nr:hypothetical protein [Streptomyces cylindrosporus]MCI3269696.1 hypothetical protein [Streptomyces cylindrosporus]
MERFERFEGFLDRNGLRNTFTHGDGGAAFEARMSALTFPPGIRPWNDADLASLTSRFGWMQTRIAELSLDNARLKRELKQTTTKPTPPATPTTSVYRRARKVVARPIRRALQSGR